MRSFPIFVLASFSCLLAADASVWAKGPFKCSDYPSTHSMCLSEKGKILPLSRSEKQAILNKHNSLRSKVSPPAKDMQILYWDDELAAIAGKWGSQCKMGHDHNPNRLAKSLPGVNIGQNMAYGYPDFEKAIEGWYSEVNNFKYGIGSANGKTVGHYTQVVLASASRVGCAKIDCTGKIKYGMVFTCNYATGQTSTQKMKPYCYGSGCSTCQRRIGNLCDCKGMVCLNGGTFDIRTCSCKCYNLYKGDQCEKKVCPATNTDSSSCTSPVFKAACSKYANWGPQFCPFFCGLCP